MKLNRAVVTVFLSCVPLACAAGADETIQQQQPTPAVAEQKTPEQKTPEQKTAAQKASLEPKPTEADAALLEDFKDRIDAYMKVYDRQEKGKAQPKETNDPKKIKDTQDTLAARIQAARSTAKHGDIFTPEIRQLFRRLMYPETRGPDGPETKKTIKEDSPSPATTAKTLKVNARFPEGQPLPTVPPNLLARLPQLPEELEYRFLDKDLILRDVNANLIVDFIPNAIR